MQKENNRDGQQAKIEEDSRSVRDLLLFSLVGHLCYFLFAIGAHENHVFVSLVLVMALGCLDERYRFLMVILSLCAAANLLFIYSFSSQPAKMWEGSVLDLCLQAEDEFMRGYEHQCRLALEGRQFRAGRAVLAVFNMVFFAWLYFVVVVRGRAPA